MRYASAMTAAPFTKPFILIGAGGHARVVLGLVRAAGADVIGVVDRKFAQGAQEPGSEAGAGAAAIGSQAHPLRWETLTILGADDWLATQATESALLALGIGQMPGNLSRARVFERLHKAGFTFPPLVHPAAWVAADVVLAPGAQIMAGAIVQPGTRLGANSVINTRASVDHDCRIGANVHVCPGATLCGDVVVGQGCFIGAGATVIQGVSIGEGAVIGAGVVVKRDVRPGVTLNGRGERILDS